jgi:hypothetical protein
MSSRMVAAFVAGALAASTGTAAALTKGHVFRLQEGDEAHYGKVTCEATYVAQYSGFRCFGAGPRYSIIYAPGEIRVLRFNGKTTAPTTVFHLGPSGA